VPDTDEPVYVPEPEPTPFGALSYPPAPPVASPRPEYSSPGLRLRPSASIAQGLLVVVIVCDLLLNKAIWDRYRLVKDAVAHPLTVTSSDLTHSDNTVHTFGVVYGVAYLTAGIAFIVWFHRAYRSAIRHNSLMTRYGAGWAIGTWLVPILNLWRPFKMTNDIRCASELTPTAREDARRGHTLIRAWWWIFIAAAISVRFYSNSDDSLDAFYRDSTLELVNGGLSIVAGVLAIAVVERLTGSNDRRREQLLAAGR